MFSILVVDDEQTQRETLAEILREKGFQVALASSAPEALEQISQQLFNVILTDFRMPGGSGLDVVRSAAQFCPETACIVMTAYADVNSVIEAMRLGAIDYLLKPVNVDALLRRLNVLQDRHDLQREVQFLRTQINRTQLSNSLVGESVAMTQVRNLIRQVAEAQGTVLITGESGTGKEVAARQLHQDSPRSQRRFVAVNCGAIPENLLESELFGYKKGAFTGATGDKDGLLTLAHEGTMFLDEIGELPKNLQVKLLRALQEREVMPVGGTKPIKIDVRIIAATNRNLEDDVESGVFRKDLYYRINVIEIKMPALRERREDIPVLAQIFLQRVAKQQGRAAKQLTNETIRQLMLYSWPGNVRELENVIERAFILSRDSEWIEVSALPVGIQSLGGDGSDSLTLENAINGFSRQHIGKILDACGGDKKEAARTLGVGLSSLYRKMEELGIAARSNET